MDQTYIGLSSDQQLHINHERCSEGLLKPRMTISAYDSRTLPHLLFLLNHLAFVEMLLSNCTGRKRELEVKLLEVVDET